MRASAAKPARSADARATSFTARCHQRGKAKIEQARRGRVRIDDQVAGHDGTMDQAAGVGALYQRDERREARNRLLAIEPAGPDTIENRNALSEFASAPTDSRSRRRLRRSDGLCLRTPRNRAAPEGGEIASRNPAAAGLRQVFNLRSRRGGPSPFTRKTEAEAVSPSGT